jgi:hypothetical protein
MALNWRLDAIDPDAVVTASSGNVLTDLGFVPGDAAVLPARRPGARKVG